jgi:hypothetical protein
MSNAMQKLGWASVDHCLIKPFPMRDLLIVAQQLGWANPLAH